ncbi:amino acid ABC transporter ATP-binding protein [Leuconostoc mesenteroides]|uniref:amino acid ABC transporter ATP-binding protein n=1 Tax=Leuconostoc mesenteroides TaxID=1245 RepID=UPI003C46A91F
MALIEVNNLSVEIKKKKILQGINFSVEKGEVTVLVGPSGSGKTTLLRTLNLLQEPSQGTIKIGGTSIDGRKINKKSTRSLRSESTMVFQQFNLFKNMTVIENVMAPLLLNKLAKWDEAHDIAASVLSEVGLVAFQDKYPSSLSGGQQQRVSIARAIAAKPSVVLLDEPTSALDPELVGSVLKTILALAKQHITMVIVTHEMEFARLIGNQIIFLENGQIVHKGSPDQVLSSNGPKRLNDFVNSVSKNNYL